MHVEKLAGCWIHFTGRCRYALQTPLIRSGKHTHTHTHTHKDTNSSSWTCLIAHVCGHVWQEIMRMIWRTVSILTMESTHLRQLIRPAAPMLKNIIAEVHCMVQLLCLLSTWRWLHFELHKFIVISVPLVDTLNLAADPTGGLFYSTSVFIFGVKHITLALHLLFFFCF